MFYVDGERLLRVAMAENEIAPLYIGGEAIAQLCAFVENRYSGQCVIVVADSHTYIAAGEAVLQALRNAGISTQVITLPASGLRADESSLSRVLTRSPVESSVFIAVGSGTITDITRYVSYRLGVRFIAFPTAASVDGYASKGSPLVIDGIKRTYFAQPPEAIFADREVLAVAPPELTAAGFGDLLGKTTSIADWRLGTLVRDELFDEGIAMRVTAAVDRCLSVIDSIAQRDPKGLLTLFGSLTETGLCMIGFGDSQPASGSEHHVSHVWEMLTIKNQQSSQTALHGAQVGIATAFSARIYEKLRALNVTDVEKLFYNRLPLSRQNQEREIKMLFGDIGNIIVNEHKEYLELTDEQQLGIADRVIKCWPEIQKIATSVPRAESITRFLEAVGSPTDPYVLGMRPSDVDAGIRGGHYLRNRFTVAKLAHMMGILVDQ